MQFAHFAENERNTCGSRFSMRIIMVVLWCDVISWWWFLISLLVTSTTCENVKYCLISKSINNNEFYVECWERFGWWIAHVDFLSVSWAVALVASAVNEFSPPIFPRLNCCQFHCFLSFIGWHWPHRHRVRSTRSLFHFHLFYRHRAKIIIRLTWFLRTIHSICSANQHLSSIGVVRFMTADTAMRHN